MWLQLISAGTVVLIRTLWLKKLLDPIGFQEACAATGLGDIMDET